MPSRAELIQYQKRFIELYRQSRCIDHTQAPEADPGRGRRRGALSHLSVVVPSMKATPGRAPSSSPGPLISCSPEAQEKHHGALTALSLDRCLTLIEL